MTVTNNEEKNQVIANLTANNKIRFQYIDRVRTYDNFPAHTNYIAESYEGVLLEVRDTTENVVSTATVYRKPEIERSRYLLTVKLNDNKIKSFYSGRVINLEEVKEVPKSFLKRTLDKIRGK